VSELDAAPVADTPVAAPAAAPVDAPAEAAPVAAEATAAVADVSPDTEKVSAPEELKTGYDFTGWDGQVDSLPEENRHTANGVASYYTALAESRNEESSRMQQIYEALISGDEDPRVAQLTQDQTALQAKFDTAASEHKAYKKQVEAFHASQAEAEAKRFIHENSKALETPKQREVFGTLLDQGWNQHSAVKLLSMAPEAIKLAQEAKNDGVPDHHAIKMADLMTRRAAPAPRDSARITSGATTTTSRPYGAENSVTDAKTLNEKRRLAVARAIRSAKG